MKPLSQEAVKRLALSHGAKLEINGSRVNSARLQVVTKATPKQPVPAPAAYMPPEPKEAPTQIIEAKPDPAVREAVLSIDNYAASQFLLNESNVQLMNTVKDLLQKSGAPSSEKRPTQWVFKVKRDAHGLMETITATAKFKE
jgi:hypothetical protein